MDSSSERSKSVDSCSEHSPTRVSDIELQDVMSETSASVREERPSDSELVPPVVLEVSVCPRNDNMLLPTLEETSSVSSSEGNLEPDNRLDEVDMVPKSPLEGDETKDEIVSGSTRQAEHNSAPQGNDAKNTEKMRVEESKRKRTFQSSAEVKKLKGTASKLASQGKEKEALKTYSQALQLMRTDLARIKHHLTDAMHEPSHRRESQLCDAWAQVASAIADIRTVMAILYERMGDYTKAIASCEEAREVYLSYAHLEAQDEVASDRIQFHVEQMDHMLARLEVAHDSFLDRKCLHEEIIQLRRRIALANNDELKQTLYETTFRTLHKVLVMEQGSLGEAHPQVADTFGIVASVYAERNEFTIAIKQMHSAVAILRLALGAHHPRTALALRELGQLYESRKQDSSDFDTAIKFYSEAITAFCESEGRQNAMVGGTLNNIAVVHVKRNEFDQAVEKLSDALTCYESAAGSSNRINPDAAQVWKNLGECYSRRNEWESALFAYTSALGVQRDSRRYFDKMGDKAARPSSSATMSLSGIDDASLADTLLRLAKATSALGQQGDALQTYEEALLIYRKALEVATENSNHHTSQDLVSAQDRVAHTLYCMAEVQEQDINYDDAMKLYSEALELRLNSDALRENQRANMIHCSMNLAGIGSVHMHKGEFTDACLALKESLKLLEAHGVPNDHEIFNIIKGRLIIAERGFLYSGSFDDEDTATDSTSTPKVDKTLVFDRRAQEQMEAGDYDEAIKTLTTVLAIRRKRLAKRKKNPDIPKDNLKEKNDVAKTLVNFATVLSRKGDVDQAASLYNEAVRMYRSNGLDSDDPCINDISHQLRRLEI